MKTCILSLVVFLAVCIVALSLCSCSVPGGVANDPMKVYLGECLRQQNAAFAARQGAPILQPLTPLNAQ